MKKTGGDDLDDDFVPDDLVALSDPETLSEDRDEAVFLSPDEEGGQVDNLRVQEKKRKRKEKERERKAKVSRPSCNLVLRCRTEAYVTHGCITETQGRRKRSGR